MKHNQQKYFFYYYSLVVRVFYWKDKIHNFPAEDTVKQNVFVTINVKAANTMKAHNYLSSAIAQC